MFFCSVFRDRNYIPQAMLLHSKTLVKSMYYCFAMVTLFLMFLILFGFIELPVSSYALEPTKSHGYYDESTSFLEEPFTELSSAFRKWDGQVGCKNYREKVMRFWPPNNNNTSLQDPDGIPCNALKLKHVSILVEGWTWIPDALDNLYSCRCGLSCLWTKSRILADQPEARLFETTTPPPTRHKGEPLRVYMDLEAGRRSTSAADIFVSYHAGDDIQATYAGSLFHNSRNYYVSPYKSNDTLVYWSSSRCLKDRDQLAGKLLSLLPHHSFGKCLNNVGGQDTALKMYPKCRSSGSGHSWSDHLHCAMSHYKFVLAIENTLTESYVTEKLFYALDVGAVPIYFGAPNVLDFVPPRSIIDGTKFSSLESLASYVKRVANDPVAYGEYHAWRRCGVIGNYHRTRAVSLDSFPCRLCSLVSKLGGKYANS